MTVLGHGLDEGGQHKDALAVGEAELSMLRRLGASEADMLAVQNNLAYSYASLGRQAQALDLRRDVYSGNLRLQGEEHRETLIAANNYAASLISLERFEEAKSPLRKTIPVARRVLGDNFDLTLGMRQNYALALYQSDGATLDDIREAVTTLEETERIARRVFGGAHPHTVDIEDELRNAREALAARETPRSG
jgi:hypothetical protein